MKTNENTLKKIDYNQLGNNLHNGIKEKPDAVANISTQK